MNKIGFVLPVLFLAIGAFLLVSGLTADGDIHLFGGRVVMASKFGILLGGIGIFIAVVAGIELFGKTRKQNPLRATDR
jgi:hypothetical protein